MNSPVWEEQWSKHLEKRKTAAEAIDEFWKVFVDGIIEVVTDDGVVDLREPEDIEAWVGPPYVKLRLDRENCRVSAAFWTQTKDHLERHLFDKALGIDDDKADSAEFGYSGFKSAAECASVVGKFLFGLRNLKDV